jgi:hypothetical protein
MKSLCFSMLMWLVIVPPCARAAEPVLAVGAIIDSFISISSAKCGESKGTSARDYKNKPFEAYQMAEAEKMLCECLPARAKALKARLSQKERAAKLTEGAFSTTYMPEIVNQCAGALMKASYAGACSERFAMQVGDSAKFCACMVKFTNNLSDAQAAQLGGESAVYMPAAAQAGKKGEAIPPPPPLLGSMLDAQKACALP